MAASLADTDRTVPPDGELALKVFDWTQRLAEIWLGSNSAARREILEEICLNRTLTDLSLCLAKKKPFDVLAERPEIEDGTPFWRKFEPAAAQFLKAILPQNERSRGRGLLTAQCA